MTGPSETIFLVDDDGAVLRAVSRLLRSAGYAVRGYPSAEEFMAAHHADTPGCLVVDIAMPGSTGLELQEWLFQSQSSLPVVFLTGCGDVPTTVRAMKGGAVDFLTKPVDEAELLGAVSAALQRGRLLRNKRSDRARVQALLNTLTAREREVFDHLLTGRLNKQIAADLGTVEKTIKVHRARVLRKLGVSSIAELVHLAERAK
ncbi:MAG: response regulator [Verrucomicrobiota bacterium]